MSLAKVRIPYIISGTVRYVHYTNLSTKSLRAATPLIHHNQIGKRTFGIELESIVSRCSKYQQHSDVLNSLNVNVMDWCIVNDPSIDTEHRHLIKADPYLKCEIVSPKLEYNNQTMRSLENLCNDLQYKLNANINESCGFHIHFDTDDLTINDIIKIAINYSYFEPIIDLFMDKNRRLSNNKYLQSIRVPTYKNMDSLFEILENAFYNKTSLSVLDMINPHRKNHKFNFSNLFYYNLRRIRISNAEEEEEEIKFINTIENRHHHSTFNYFDMLNWIRFNLLFIHHSKNKPLFLREHMMNEQKVSDHMQDLADFIEEDDIMEFYLQKTLKNK